MRTIIKNGRSQTSNDKVTVIRFMNYFYKFSKKEQAKIAERINETTFKRRWDELDKLLPDLDMGEDDIMNEVRAVRYGRKESKNSA